MFLFSSFLFSLLVSFSLLFFSLFSPCLFFLFSSFYLLFFFLLFLIFLSFLSLLFFFFCELRQLIYFCLCLINVGLFLFVCRVQYNFGLIPLQHPVIEREEKNEIIETLLTMSFDWNQNIYLITYYQVQIYVTHIYKLFCIYFRRKETD